MNHQGLKKLVTFLSQLQGLPFYKGFCVHINIIYLYLKNLYVQKFLFFIYVTRLIECTRHFFSEFLLNI